MDRLKDRVAVMVGGADEVRGGIARKFLAEGAQVAFLNDTGARDGETVNGVSVLSVDLGERPAVKAALAEIVKRLGGLHILVNDTLPPPAFAPIESKTGEEIGRALEGVRAAIVATQAILPHFRSQLWGRIINVGSRFGETMNVFNGEYNMAAWALRGLTRTTAAECARYHIAVNYLDVAVDSVAFRTFRAEQPDAVDALVGQVALGRRGDPVRDIGAAAVFLAGNSVNWMTGQVVHADGGQHMAAPAFIPAVHQGFFEPSATTDIYGYD
jgi:NAD(P)-dependent dehydrogenase (short-subunit alcohol dehydrogenase family)